MLYGLTDFLNLLSKDADGASSRCQELCLNKHREDRCVDVSQCNILEGHLDLIVKSVEQLKVHCQVS